MPLGRGSRWLGIGLTAAALTGCGPGGGDVLSAEARLGERIFHDRTLSASRRQSCADCHAAAAGHAQDNGLAAQNGGVDLREQGLRSSPSVRYLAFAPPFRISSTGEPSGGLFWDGRASSLAEQATRPFLNAREMALPDARALADRLAEADYAADFRARFGADILERPAEALQRVGQSLAAFQQEDRRFAPFSSTFDDHLRGSGTLDAAARRGLAVFNDPLRGNCAACHPSARGADGSMPLFTDFSYHALGVPRNAELLANADPAHFDLGLCARDGGDLRHRSDLCGHFRVPSLRNVALRQAFFHNGRFKSLRDVLSFYARRDTHPETFYPVRPDGAPDRFDDLPPALRTNVRHGPVPYDRLPGQAAALSESDIDDLLAFLHTLTDAAQR